MIDTETSVSKIIYKNSETDTGTVIPIYPEQEYKRPSDWLQIPEMDGTKDEIYILNGVGEYCLNQVSFIVKGAGTVDWGDGVVENFTSAGISTLQLYHNYDHEAVSMNTWTNHNDTKQVLAHIYADRGAITEFRMDVTYKIALASGGTINTSSLSTNIYEVKANVEYCTISVGSSGSSIYHNFLEIFDWQGELSNTSLAYCFGYKLPNLRIIPQLISKNATSMVGIFANCYKLMSVNFKDLDTSQMTSMYNAFYNCKNLTSLDVSNFNTSKVTNMSYMFRYCSKLINLDVSNFNTSNVTTFEYMFDNCKQLISLDVSNFNTSKVTNMWGMFMSCEQLTSLDLSSFDTSNAKIGDMFMYDANLEELIISKKFKVIKSDSSNFRVFHSCKMLKNIKLDIGDATSIFQYCENLRTAEINTSNVNSFYQTFYFCQTLKDIKIDMSNATKVDSAFYNCLSLKNIELYNLNANYQDALTISINTNYYYLNATALVKLFNSVAVNVNAYSRTIQLGNTLQGYLANVYVKDSGEVYTIILPTSDTEVDPNKTYYTYDAESDTYTQVVPDFTSNTFYYELKTATWNRYDICESTEAGAMLALDFARNVKGYTIT